MSRRARAAGAARRAGAGHARERHLDHARERRDPLEVPIEDKVALLLAANEAALKVKNVRFVNSGLALLREGRRSRRPKARTSRRRSIRVGPSFSATAIGDRRLPDLRRGARAARFRVGVRRVAEHAGERRAVGVDGGEKLTAKSVEAGRTI